MVLETNPPGLEGDQRTGSVPDISSLGPGAYSLGPTDSPGAVNVPAYMERMTTDISALKKQYAKLRQRQAQAHIILNSASSRQVAPKTKPIAPTIETPIAVNHLFLTKQGKMNGKNRFVTASPRIANMYPITPPYSVTSAGQRKVQPINQVHGDITKSGKRAKWKEGKNQSNNSIKAVEEEITSDINAHHLYNVAEELDKISEVDKETLAVDHNDDSGVGTSLSSPVHSYSSTDCSPKHSSESGKPNNVKMSDSVHSQRLDEFYEDTKDVWEPDECAEDKMEAVSESGLDLPDANVSWTEKEKEIPRDAKKVDIIDEQESGIIHTDQPSDTLQDADHGEGDKNNSSSNLAVHDLDNDKPAIQQLDKYAMSQDNSHQTTSKSGDNESDITADNVRSHSDGARVRLSDLRSSNSSGSGFESDHLPEVFSPGFNNTQAESFQQYYNNKRNLSVDSASSLQAQLKKCNLRQKTFNPFPIKHVNQNRAKTGIKLGLYKPATLEEFERNLKNQSVWGK